MWNPGEIAERPDGVVWRHTTLIGQGGGVQRLAAVVIIEALPLAGPGRRGHFPDLFSPGGDPGAEDFPELEPGPHLLAPDLAWQRNGDARIMRWSLGNPGADLHGLTATSTWAPTTNQVEPGHPAKWFTLDHDLALHAQVPIAVRASVRFEYAQVTRDTSLRGLAGAWHHAPDGTRGPLPLGDIPLGALAALAQPIRLDDFPKAMSVRSDWDGIIDVAALSSSGYTALVVDARAGLALMPTRGPLTIGLPDRPSWTGRTTWRVSVERPGAPAASTDWAY